MANIQPVAFGALTSSGQGCVTESTFFPSVTPTVIIRFAHEIAGAKFTFKSLPSALSQVQVGLTTPTGVKYK